MKIRQMKIRQSSKTTFRRIRLVPLAVALFLFTAAIPHAAGQAIQLVDPKHDHPAPGTKLTYFQKIDEDVYKGSKPRTDADYRFLKSKHIKYIVELRFTPFLDHHERSKARENGIVVIPVTVNASVVSPSEKHIRRVLCLLSDKHLRPVYFHCTLGRDRTALIAALYEIYFRDLPREQAREEMKSFGFNDHWYLSGLSRYLEKHASSPWDNGKDTCQRFRLATADQQAK